jgi:hypothetical protein
MGAIDYYDGSYLCAACHAKLRVPAGSQIRRGFTTAENGARERIVFADGTEIHRCTAAAPGD